LVQPGQMPDGMRQLDRSGASEMASDFDPLAPLRHELRTPLNAIIGYSEVLIEEIEDGGLDFPPAVLHTLQRCVSVGHELLGGIQQILGYHQSIPDGQVLSMQLQDHCLPALDELDASVITLRHYAPQFSEDLGSIQLAEHRMRMLLMHVQFDAPVAGHALVVVEPESGSQNRDRLRANSLRGRILVVDDQVDNRLVLKRRLELLGHTVILADSGETALQTIETSPVDLVLLDIFMPRMDGFTVLGRIRSREDLSHLSVVVLSALDDESSVVKALELGADDYLTKPFNPIILRARVNACLEKKRLRDLESRAREEIEAQRARVEELIHVIMPRQIVAELKRDHTVQPRRHENVAVLFCDIVDFTRHCDQTEPEEVVRELQTLVESFEQIALNTQLQKIKTIGDSFMAAAGLLSPVDNPVLACVEAGLEMVQAVRHIGTAWRVRVGIHIGPVVAGVVGRYQYLYDLWGDTVNIAARTESSGRNDAVTVSAVAWQHLDGLVDGESLGAVNLKGKGEMELFVVHRIRTHAEG